MHLAWWAAALCSGLGACAPGVNQSNGVKMGEALAFMAAAGAAQVVQTAAEERARNEAAVRHASGIGLSSTCEPGNYACVTVASSPGPARPPEPDLSDEEARDYVLGYVNGVRKLHAVVPVVRDAALDAFARAGSGELSEDHVPGRHLADAAQPHAASAELQGPAEGSAEAPIQDQLAEILLRVMDEGPTGERRAILLRPEWRALGVGIVHHGDRMYVTVDFAR